MEQKEQRVIDLSKIDSNEKAFLLGFIAGSYRCKNENDELIKNNLLVFSVDYKQNYINKLKDFLVEYFDATYTDVENQNIKQLFINKLEKNKAATNIDINKWRYKKCYLWCKFSIKVTENSKTFINSNLATVKNVFYPYLLCGILTAPGSIVTSNFISFFKKEGTNKLLNKQLQQWYNVKSFIKEKIYLVHNKKFTELRLLENENIKKFLSILPKNYIEYFSIC